MASGKWNEIAASLRTAILSGAVQPGDRLPSETVLAAQWQVCRMTAHRALGELEREGLVTRKRRVGTVVAEPAQRESSPRNGGSSVRHVALVSFHINDYPQVEYIHGFRSGLPRDCHMLLCDTDNKPANEADYLRRLRSEADAVCLYPSGDPANTPLIRDLAEAGKPVVCLDRVPAGLPVDGFVTDNHGSTLTALRNLTIRGHRRIAFLGTDNPTLSSIRERYTAYRDALAEVGETEAAASLVHLFPPGLGYKFDNLAKAVYDALEAMSHLPDPPTSLFCLDDFFLAAAVEACDRRGLLLPEDMEILSFSDCPPLAPRLTRNIHRIRQSAFEMGRLAAIRLHARLDGTLTVTTPPEVVRIPAMVYPASIATNSFSRKEVKETK